jgi:hypothetical protein
MTCCSRFPIVAITAAVVVAGSLAFAQASKDKPTTPPKSTNAAPAAGHGDMQMPPAPKGWTDAEWQAANEACMKAGTPGKQHEMLASNSGVWTGDSKFWMAPETDPMNAKTTSTITPVMDGRFVKCEVSSDMMGMPFRGEGIYGYDNVTSKWQCTWIDNMGTTLMTGTGDVSSDGKTMTWTYNYTDPYTKKASTMREVQTTTGKDTKTLAMYMTDPKSGKEFKMMETPLTRKPGTGVAAAGSN